MQDGNNQGQQQDGNQGGQNTQQTTPPPPPPNEPRSNTNTFNDNKGLGDGKNQEKR